MKKRNGENAYFTVEAVLVLPITLSVVLLVIFLLIFQYNRCLQEQDAATLALWGSEVERRQDATLETLIEDKMQEMYKEKYLCWEIAKWDAKVEGNKCSVIEAGSLTFPVPGWNIWNDENVWNAKAEYCFDRLDEVTFIRMFNRFLNKE